MNVISEGQRFGQWLVLEQSEGREGKVMCRCECGIEREVPIPLTLHHINGIHNDNRLENLMILCYNCHALTPDWAGRGSGKNRKKKQSPDSKTGKATVSRTVSSDGSNPSPGTRPSSPAAETEDLKSSQVRFESGDGHLY